MVRHWGCFYTFLMVSMSFLSGLGFTASDTEALLSQNTGEQFIRQAQTIYQQDAGNPQRIEQAMTFLDGALLLDEMSIQIPEQIIKIGAAGVYMNMDYSQSINWALNKQVDEQANLEVLNKAVEYLLHQQNSRLDREVLLEQLIRKYAAENKAFVSDLATQLGLLTAEKADIEGAVKWLSYAYQTNPYNLLAFAKLQELSQRQDLSVTPSAYMKGLRTALEINPYDLNSVLEYAESLKNMQLYPEAMAAYAYTANVYEYLYPAEPLDEAILIPWIFCCYHTPRQEGTCQEVVQHYNDSQGFDLVAQAVAGKAMIKQGQVQQGKTALQEAGKKAEQMLMQTDLNALVTPEQLAWFYSFVLDDSEKALAWANRANKEAPERQGVREIFAYALTQSGQADLGKEFAEDHKDSNQIASLTLAIASIADGNQTDAVNLLKSTIQMSPESFVAEKALQLLKQQGADYTVPTYPGTVLQDLAVAFGEQSVVPQYLVPNKRISTKLLFNGSEFFYGNEMSPKLIIENTSNAPLLIGPGGMLQGRLQVDAVLSGDLNVKLPNILTMSFRPSRPVMPGEHASVPLAVRTGKLQQILLTYPQADIQVEFTVYLDPVSTTAGDVKNQLNGIDPVVARIQRPGVDLTRDFLMQRLDVLANGSPGQQFRAVRLFSGLLAEQKAFQINKADFRHVQVDQVLLIDTVRKALRDENWKVRVEALDALLTLSVPLDTTLMTDISQNLQHDKWPVRLMSMFLLARAQQNSFSKVLDWTVQQDPHWLNRRMALSLGAKEPEKSQPQPGLE